MKLSDLGEFKLIHRSILPVLGGQAPLGDDCGWINLGRGQVLLASTDSLVENSHYKKSWMPPAELAVKALRAAASDIAAMGSGRSLAALTAMGLNKKTDISGFNGFMSALRREADQWKIKILGGDLVETRGHEFVAMTVLGISKKPNLLLRSNAKPGDILWLTGPVGLSKAGLEYLECRIRKQDLTRVMQIEHSAPPLYPSPLMGEGSPAGQSSTQSRALDTGQSCAKTQGRVGVGFARVVDLKKFKKLAAYHKKPPLRLKEGEILSKRRLSRAAIDLSDSLACSLLWLARQSKADLETDLNRLPVPEILRQWAEERGKPLDDYLLYGGEDYELLFSSPCREQIIRRFLPESFPIGRVVKGNGLVRATGLTGKISLINENRIGYQAFRDSKP